MKHTESGGRLAGSENVRPEFAPELGSMVDCQPQGTKGMGLGFVFRVLGLGLRVQAFKVPGVEAEGARRLTWLNGLLVTGLLTPGLRNVSLVLGFRV